MPEKTVYLSLGSNLGDRESNLRRGLEALENDDVRVLKRSSVYETEPQDVIAQPWFLNMAVECETRCFPMQLLTVLQSVERGLGRVRSGAAKGPRPIDLDILLFGNAIIETPKLVIPHPRMLERRFVLEPLLEIAPELRDPRTREPLRNYLHGIAGQRVRKIGP